MLTDPRDRIVYTPARRTNIVFCYAEALWYLWGRDDLEMISYYAPRLAKVSADGHTLTGTAYGPKLFKPTGTSRSQWDRVLHLLAEEPASKRAVVSFFRPEELIDPANPDVSCTLGLQLLLRDGHLDATAYMRGNDAVVGLLCDVPLKAMPPTRWADLKTVEHYEGALRRNEEQLDPRDLGRLGLHPYWQQVVLLLEVYRQISHHPGAPVTPSTLEALDPGYRWLITHRWPAAIPGNFTLLPCGAEQ